MRYTPIHSKTFTDKKFRSLSSDAKLIFLYLLAHDNSSISGIFEVAPDLIDMMISTERGFLGHAQEIETQGMIRWDPDNNLVWIVNKWKYNHSKSPSVAQHVIKELSRIDHRFKNEFFERYKSEFNNTTPNVSDVLSEAMLNEDHIRKLMKINYKISGIKNYFVTKGFDYNKVDVEVDAIMKKISKERG